MPLVAVLAGEKDAARAAAIQSAAFGPNAASAVVFPGPFPKGDEGRVNSLVQELRQNRFARHVKTVDEELATQGAESTVAFSSWFIYDEPLTEASLPDSSGNRPGINAEAYQLFLGEGGMKKKLLERFEGKRLVYLKVLVTHPDHQRRGAGGLLLQWGLAEADRLGLPAYLEASAEGRPLYERFGFVTEDILRTDFTRWDGPSEVKTYLMVRPPAAQ